MMKITATHFLPTSCHMLDKEKILLRLLLKTGDLGLATGSWKALGSKITFFLILKMFNSWCWSSTQHLGQQAKFSTTKLTWARSEKLKQVQVLAAESDDSRSILGTYRVEGKN